MLIDINHDVNIKYNVGIMYKNFNVRESECFHCGNKCQRELEALADHFIRYWSAGNIKLKQKDCSWIQAN